MTSMPTLYMHTWDVGSDKAADLAINRWIDQESGILSLSFGKGIIALFNDGTWSWTEVTKLLDNKLRGRQRTLPKPTYVSCDAGENYFIAFADGKCEWCGPHSFTEAIYSHQNAVKRVAFASKNGWYILFQDGTSVWNELPSQLNQLLKRKLYHENSVMKVKDISISPAGHWFVSFTDNSWYVDVPLSCRRSIDSLLHRCSPRIDHIWLGKEDSFCIRYEVQGKLTHLSPWEILFSETSVPAHFTNGCSLWKAIGDLERRTLVPTDFPAIRAIRKNKRWISLDNRRLFVFQNATVSSIPVLTFNASPQKEINIHRSVDVLPCNCNQCNYDQLPSEFSEKEEKNSNDAWARSWSWLLFLHEESPPSVLLLADNLILPSAQHTHRDLPKYISDTSIKATGLLPKKTYDNSICSQLLTKNAPLSSLDIITK